MACAVEGALSHVRRNRHTRLAELVLARLVIGRDFDVCALALQRLDLVVVVNLWAETVPSFLQVSRQSREVVLQVHGQIVLDGSLDVWEWESVAARQPLVQLA